MNNIWTVMARRSVPSYGIPFTHTKIKNDKAKRRPVAHNYNVIYLFILCNFHVPLTFCDSPNSKSIIRQATYTACIYILYCPRCYISVAPDIAFFYYYFSSTPLRYFCIQPRYFVIGRLLNATQFP